MKHLYTHKPLRLLTLLFLALSLSACAKTVKWEEEVLLNTGETIWIKRKALYKYRGASGNPLDFDWRPDWKKHIYFDYNGKSYHYYGDASLSVLAISPENTPVLVAPAGSASWDWNHRFLCAVPHYVQLTPKENGEEWYWPPQIEPWLYGLKTNLLRELSLLDSGKRKFTMQDKSTQFDGGIVDDYIKFIEHDYKDPDCPKFFQPK